MQQIFIAGLDLQVKTENQQIEYSMINWHGIDPAEIRLSCCSHVNT